MYGWLHVLESKDPSELDVLDNKHKDVRLDTQVSFLVMVSKSKETTSPETISLDPVRLCREMPLVQISLLVDHTTSNVSIIRARNEWMNLDMLSGLM